MSAPTTIEDDFSKLFSDPSKIVFCAYMNLGLLCLDNTNNKLTLVSAVASTAGQSQVVFGKISTISLCPSPPTTAEFQIIVPNKNGSKLALVGLRMVVVVDMNESFWMSASLLSPENVSELQSEYFSKCQILHMSLVVSNSAPAVVKVNWYMNLNHHAISGRSISIVRSNLLAVLFSDNIIRFYDVKNCLEKALFFVDFGQLLPDEPDTEDKLFHSGHAMGLIPQIVSFDFGPTVSSDGNDFATVFAMDSDGELYFAAFNWTDLKCFLPSGPLIIANNNSSSKFVCAASDLLFVRHALSSTIPVFSMSSSEGVISHLVLVQSQSSNFLASNGKNVFELFVFDSLQMDNWSSSSFCLSLQNDSSDRATYFAVNSNNLYVVDANAWVTDVSTRISSEGFVH